MNQKILDKFKSGKLDQINKQMSVSRNKMDDHITQREVEIMNYKMANEMLTRYSSDELIEHALVDAVDAYLFGQVNDGNCIAMPFAQGFGWGAEINLHYTFEKLFSETFGGGYPKERREPEQRNKKILDQVKTVTHRPLIEILKEIDQDFLKETIAGDHFTEYFYPNCQDDEIANYLKSL